MIKSARLERKSAVHFQRRSSPPSSSKIAKLNGRQANQVKNEAICKGVFQTKTTKTLLNNENKTYTLKISKYSHSLAST